MNILNKVFSTAIEMNSVKKEINKQLIDGFEVGRIESNFIVIEDEEGGTFVAVHIKDLNPFLKPEHRIASVD